jgi:hypothetical protein
MALNGYGNRILKDLPRSFSPFFFSRVFFGFLKKRYASNTTNGVLSAEITAYSGKKPARCQAANAATCMRGMLARRRCPGWSFWASRRMKQRVNLSACSKEILDVEGKNWYNFRYANPSYLSKE